jgi:hypothetical protein
MGRRAFEERKMIRFDSESGGAITKYSGVAQLVEQEIVNFKAGGSKPSLGAAQ